MTELNTEQFIRTRASMGWSREMVREALGISDMKFRAIVAAVPDAKWPKNGQSVDRKRYYESLKGQPCPPGRAEALRRGREVQRERMSVHELCGVRGTVTELCKLWGEYVTVDRSTVQRRLNAGVNKYDAFFGPATPKTRCRHSPWGTWGFT